MDVIDEARAATQPLFQRLRSDKAAALEEMEEIYQRALVNCDDDGERHKQLIYFLSKQGFRLAVTSDGPIDVVKAWLGRALDDELHNGSQKDFLFITAYLMFSTWCQDLGYIAEAKDAVAKARTILETNQNFKEDIRVQEDNSIRKHEDRLRKLLSKPE